MYCGASTQRAGSSGGFWRLEATTGPLFFGKLQKECEHAGHYRHVCGLCWILDRRFYIIHRQQRNETVGPVSSPAISF